MVAIRFSAPTSWVPIIYIYIQWTLNHAYYQPRWQTSVINLKAPSVLYNTSPLEIQGHLSYYFPSTFSHIRIQIRRYFIFAFMYITPGYHVIYCLSFGWMVVTYLHLNWNINMFAFNSYNLMSFLDIYVNSVPSLSLSNQHKPKHYHSTIESQQILTYHTASFLSVLLTMTLQNDLVFHICYFILL